MRSGRVGSVGVWEDRGGNYTRSGGDETWGCARSVRIVYWTDSGPVPPGAGRRAARSVTLRSFLPEESRPVRAVSRALPVIVALAGLFACGPGDAGPGDDG